jgi:phosphoribosylformylglycinamidine synthase
VKRVERGLRLDLAGLPPPGDARWPALNAALLRPDDAVDAETRASRPGRLFETHAAGALEHVPLAQLDEADARLGLALSPTS